MPEDTLPTWANILIDDLREMRTDMKLLPRLHQCTEVIITDITGLKDDFRTHVSECTEKFLTKEEVKKNGFENNGGILIRISGKTIAVVTPIFITVITSISWAMNKLMGG